jgi:hypothetical protein
MTSDASPVHGGAATIVGEADALKHHRILQKLNQLHEWRARER